MTQNITTDRPSVWPCLSFRDAGAALGFLVDAFGFVERARATASGAQVVRRSRESQEQFDLAWSRR